ncbi:Uncharacterised protein [Staphylococcus argenteus]|uniref:hypothetical protein n=1 Tax=Staphylococcus argenteus TaxID=985002 RepID=UPI0005AAA32A|nr:hypothetical protein [Staphylococcus argenteus]SUJ21243.1 Uncharacterised protein [Staphylococcus argenteus]HDY9443981.1 hypothetical protein [Staphylococcus argenteus]
MVADLRSARVERCQAKMDAMSRIETARSLFLCQIKSRYEEEWLGEVKTFESDETRNERNDFS